MGYGAGRDNLLYMYNAIRVATMLDSIETVKSADRKDMLGTIEEMPKHLSEGLRRGRMSGLPRFTPKDVLVCGMGGSAISGDLLCAWMAESSEVHCEVRRDYTVPPHIDKNSLVIVASYSGNTEESISMLEDARRKRAKIVCVCSGGKLADMAEAMSIPYARIATGMVPRASLGFIFGAVAGIVERVGVVSADKQFEEMLRVLTHSISQCRSSVKTADNPAKKLAHELFSTVPVVIGYGLSAPVARRWADQMNENGKSLAFASELPEMDHNAIVGWMQDPRCKLFSPVFLQYETSNDAMRARVEATKAMLCTRVPVHIVNATGVSPLARMFSLVAVGDFASAYLGILRNEDPSTTGPIEELKAILAKK